MDINVSSQIVVQTAAQWAADNTVYSAKRILVTSDAYYGSTDQRKFKIADGTQSWSNLDYFPLDVALSLTLSQVLANANTTGANDIIISNARKVKGSGGNILVGFGNDDSFSVTTDADAYLKAWLYLSNISTLIGYGAATSITMNDSQLSIDAPNINLQQGIASRIVETDASKNLTFVAKNTAYNLNLGTTAGTVLEGNRISQVITNGVTDKAPSEDAVFDALALKANLTDSRFIIRTSDTTRYTNTGSTTENVITSLLISAGTYTNKVFEVYVKTITSTGANNKTFRMYFNSTPDLTGSPVLAATYQTSTTGGSFSRKFKDLGTTIKNYIATTTSFSQFEAATTSTSTENTLAVNLTGNMYIVLTAQNQISGESAIIDFCYTQNIT